MQAFSPAGDGIPGPGRTSISALSFCLNKPRDASFIAIWNHKKIGLVAVAHVLANSEEILSAPNQVGLFCVTNQDRVTRQGGQSLRELQFHKQPPASSQCGQYRRPLNAERPKNPPRFSFRTTIPQTQHGSPVRGGVPIAPSAFRAGTIFVF